MLREGNVHSAKDWKVILKPIVVRYRNRERIWNRSSHDKASGASSKGEVPSCDRGP
jgi:hypothetical protein